MQSVSSYTVKIRDNIEKVFFGKTEVIDMLIAALFARGHVLLEDVPGMGKTILAKSLAASLGLKFARIQGTPDLLPADILGVSIWQQKEERFVYRRGPIVNQFVLVDEINRATPRTQAALLEAMAEGQISVDGKRLLLPEPFFVVATENPVEFEGTFPLPEAQKDRFLLSLSIGYPDPLSETKILEQQRRLSHPVSDLKPVVPASEILALQEAVTKIYVDRVVCAYLLALVAATRQEASLRSGISPRGSLALYRSAQAWAAIHNRDYVSPEDVKTMVLPVFRQRLLLSPEATVRGIVPQRIIESILDQVPIPEYRAP
jgi:MoxR-like ATPase